MKRRVLTIIGILGLSLVAATLTEATLALGHRGRLSDDHTVAPLPPPTPSLTPPPTPSSPPSTPTPTSTPTPAPTAVTNGFVHLRAGASTSTAIIADLQGGTVLTLGSYSDSQWQQIIYNGQTGYVAKVYLNY